MGSSAHVIDVTDQSFEQAVLTESRRRPVVVDFWAPWCGPCRALGPVLERLAGEGGGKWLLAKVNTDENPRVAQAMRIRGIPAVKAFHDGKLVNEFTGALPEAQVRAFLEELVPSETRQMAERAAALLASGQSAEAEALARQVVQAEPGHALGCLVLAEVALAAAKLDDAEAWLGQVKGGDDLGPALERARARLEVGRQAAGAGDEPELRRRLEQAPDDVGALLGVAAYEALAGDVGHSFERALSAVRRGGEAKSRAHPFALALLHLVPDEQARDLRRQLSMALF